MSELRGGLPRCGEALQLRQPSGGALQLTIRLLQLLIALFKLDRGLLHALL